MPIFRYSAYRPDGKETSGTVEAESLRDARLRLKRDGLFPREIAAAEDGSTGPLGSLRKKVPLPELALMTRRLATLIGSAVPLHEALDTLHRQERPGELQRVLGRVKERVSEGSPLARALAAEPSIFSESYVSMVAAGEASGALESILDSLADFLEDQAEVRSKVATALAYPLLMMVVGSGVMLFLLAFVIPKIVTVFTESKAALPLITVILIKVSTVIRKGWWLFLGFAVAAVLLYRRYGRSEAMRRREDRLLLRLPLVGPLLQRLTLARFARVLGLLLKSGVPVIRAMEIIGEVAVNREYRSFLLQVKGELIEGGSLSAGLAKSPLFPPLLVHMIGVGEKGGTLEEMLAKAGKAFEKEFEGAISRSMALLEPLLVLGMGLCVGIVVLAVLLPIFELNQLIR